jgi:hypothetical protein
MISGSELVPDWDHRGYPIDRLPPLYQVQTWLHSCRQLEKQDDSENIILRRKAVKAALQEDWNQSKNLLFRKNACKNPGPAGYLSEKSQRHMISQPEEIHAQLEYHWVKGIFQHYKEKEKPTWEAFANEYQDLLGPKRQEFKLPPITAGQLAANAKWRGGTHGLDGWRYRELRLLPNVILGTFSQILSSFRGTRKP